MSEKKQKKHTQLFKEIKAEIQTKCGESARGLGLQGEINQIIVLAIQAWLSPSTYSANVIIVSELRMGYPTNHSKYLYLTTD